MFITGGIVVISLHGDAVEHGLSQQRSNKWRSFLGLGGSSGSSSSDDDDKDTVEAGGHVDAQDVDSRGKSGAPAGVGGGGDTPSAEVLANGDALQHAAVAAAAAAGPGAPGSTAVHQRQDATSPPNQAAEIRRPTLSAVPEGLAVGQEMHSAGPHAHGSPFGQAAQPSEPSRPPVSSVPRASNLHRALTAPPKGCDDLCNVPEEARSKALRSQSRPSQSPDAEADNMSPPASTLRQRRRPKELLASVSLPPPRNAKLWAGDAIQGGSEWRFLVAGGGGLLLS